MTKEEYKAQLLEDIEAGEYETTENVEECIYIIDGVKVFGDFYDGVRGLDHNALIRDGINWEELAEFGAIVVPERCVYIANETNEEAEAAGFVRLTDKNDTYK